jgi:hypothetical protein
MSYLNTNIPPIHPVLRCHSVFNLFFLVNLLQWPHALLNIMLWKLREVRLSSLISALDGDEWSASRLCRVVSGSHWIGRWVGHRVGLDAVCTAGKRTQAVQPAAVRVLLFYIFSPLHTSRLGLRLVLWTIISWIFIYVSVNLAHDFNSLLPPVYMDIIPYGPANPV